jgi:hypothetical protein
VTTIYEIPPMTDPLSWYWEQPPRNDVLLDDSHALMTQKTFDKLHEYSTATPSGVYPGKMWKARGGKNWYLRWYDAPDGHPDGLPTRTREIILVKQ